MLHWCLLISVCAITCIKLTHSQCASDSGPCNIRCDGDHYCGDTTITCPANRDCAVDCYYNHNRRLLITQPINDVSKQQRNLLSVYTCSGSKYGCCDSVIICPANQDCAVDCERGCNGVTIYAQNSNSLLVSNCDAWGNRNYCGNMEIYCPRNGPAGTQNICAIQGSSSLYQIENTNIYTEEGLNDVYFNTVSASNTRVFCGENASEYSCIVAANGSVCASAEPTICNTFIIPTISPTKSPTKTPSHSPTNRPTLTPTANALNMTAIAATSIVHAQSAEIVQIITSMDTEGIVQEIDGSGHKNFWRGALELDLAVKFILFCALLLLCCICLFGGYWCRKEIIYMHIQKELTVDGESKMYIDGVITQDIDGEMGEESVLNEGMEDNIIKFLNETVVGGTGGAGYNFDDIRIAECDIIKAINYTNDVNDNEEMNDMVMDEAAVRNLMSK